MLPGRHGRHKELRWVGVGTGAASSLEKAPAPFVAVEMGESCPSSSIERDQDGSSSPRRKAPGRKLSLLPLVFLIFYEVSGGPFGVEDSVQAGGPLLALLGFLLFPLVWSIPEALITAEMGTMFPENGGYVVWISAAFGPYWGFQQGWWKWMSGVIDNALYPVLFLDYLKSALPAVSGGLVKIIAVLVITAALTYLNYRGLTIVGWAAVGLGVFSLLPFGVMAILAIPRLNPANWFIVDINNVDWTTYLNTLFWNLNYWDSVSTLAGEVDNAQRTLPRALFSAVLLVVGGYFVPLLAGTASIALVRSDWSDGYFADVAKAIGGGWLRWWIEAAAALSNMGSFEAEMSSDSFQLLGMAERGMLPQFFAGRSVYGTPTLGILASAFGVLLLSWMSFDEIVAAENFLYCFGMLVEFAAFIWLRKFKPEMPRPYRIPLGVVGVTFMCIPPTLLLLLVMALASWKVVIVCFTIAFVGFVLYPCLVIANKRKWFLFTESQDLPKLSMEEISEQQKLDEDSSDAEIALLSEGNS